MVLLNTSIMTSRFCGRVGASVASFASRNIPTSFRCFSTKAAAASPLVSEATVVDGSNAPREEDESFLVDDKAVLHHGKRPRYRNYVKFKSPRRRASKLLHELQQEAVEKSKDASREVFDTNFRVGDAIELELVPQGGVNSSEREKVRGVVLGKINRGLGTSIYLRDVVFGEPVERKIPLHSPLVKSLRVLEENFVFKKKRKVKRAKLYYLRDRNPVETRVTKW